MTYDGSCKVQWHILPVKCEQDFGLSTVHSHATLGLLLGIRKCQRLPPQQTGLVSATPLDTSFL